MTMQRITFVVALLASCRPEFSASLADDSPNAQPLALAGVGTRVQIGTSIPLDGTASFDPDGDTLTYAWRSIHRPPTSDAEPVSADAALASFVPDVAGSYTFGLDVRDLDGATSHDEVTFDVIAEAIVSPMLMVSAGSDTTVEWLARAQATGSVSAANGFTPTYQWTMTGRPFYSNARLDNIDTLTPSFVADAQGTYTLELAATAGSETRTDTVVVTASTTPRDVGDAVAVAYSSTLDRLVLLRDNLDLSVIDPVTGLGTTISLPFTTSAFPSGLALHPLGLRAVVAGDQEIVTVNLQTPAAEQAFSVAHSVEMVFAPDNRVHSFPSDTADSIRTLNVATGTVVTSSPTMGPFVRGALHPSGTVMYVVDASASSIARYDISTSPITLVRQVSLPSLTGTPFVIADGTRIIAGAGQVLRSSATAATDMTQEASLDVGYIMSVATSSASDEIAMVSYPSSGPLKATWLSAASLIPRFVAPLVEITGNECFRASVAYRADGARMYLLCWQTTWNVYTVTPPP